MSPIETTRVFVLHVGEPSWGGGFGAANWPLFSRWCGRMASTALVYFSNSTRSVPESIQKIGLGSSLEAFPDSEAALSGLRVEGSAEQVERLLKELSFDPENGVTHLFLFAGARILASIESDDGANFVILEMTSTEALGLAKELGDLAESVRMCRVWARFIDDMVEVGCPWEPLRG